MCTVNVTGFSSVRLEFHLCVFFMTPNFIGVLRNTYHYLLNVLVTTGWFISPVALGWFMVQNIPSASHSNS